jgi:hypothetical protein
VIRILGRQTTQCRNAAMNAMYGRPSRLRRADNRRMEFVRSLFRPFCTDEDDVEVRSMTAYRPQYQCPFG